MYRNGACCAQFDLRSAAQELPHQLCDIPDLKFSHGVGAMKVDRSRTYSEIAGGLLARHAFEDLTEYDAFTFGQGGIRA